MACLMVLLVVMGACCLLEVCVHCARGVRCRDSCRFSFPECFFKKSCAMDSQKAMAIRATSPSTAHFSVPFQKYSGKDVFLFFFWRFTRFLLASGPHGEATPSNDYMHDVKTFYGAFGRKGGINDRYMVRPGTPSPSCSHHYR